MKRQVVFFGLFLFTVCLIFSKPVEAAPFEFEAIYEEGRIHLIGEAEFACAVSGITIANVYYGSPFVLIHREVDEGSTVAFDTYHEFDYCVDPGSTLNYKAEYLGSTLEGENCVAMHEVVINRSVTIPEWRYLEIIEPADGIVSGIEEITVEYDTPFFFGGNRCLQITVCGNEIFYQCDMPKSGRVTTHYDFSEESSETEIEIIATLYCNGPVKSKSKDVCVEECPPP
jgi:hypothetical protein